MDQPLLDDSLADEVFAPASADEAAQLRLIVGEFEADLAPRFEVLRSLCGAPDDRTRAAQRQLHSLRGATANFACARAAERLRRLEFGWAEARLDERRRELAAAEGEIQAGLNLLRERHPLLRG